MLFVLSFLLTAVAILSIGTTTILQTDSQGLLDATIFMSWWCWVAIALVLWESREVTRSNSSSFASIAALVTSGIVGIQNQPMMISLQIVIWSLLTLISWVLLSQVLEPILLRKFEMERARETTETAPRIHAWNPLASVEPCDESGKNFLELIPAKTPALIEEGTPRTGPETSVDPEGDGWQSQWGEQIEWKRRWRQRLGRARYTHEYSEIVAAYKLDLIEKQEAGWEYGIQTENEHIEAPNSPLNTNPGSVESGLFLHTCDRNDSNEEEDPLRIECAESRKP